MFILWKLYEKNPENVSEKALTSVFKSFIICIGFGLNN